MSDSTSCSECQTTTLQASLHTCEPCGTSCQQMAESQANEGRAVGYTQQDSFSPNRRRSADGPIGPGSGSSPARGLVDAERFHPYRRPFRDPQTRSPSFGCLQEAFSPDTSSQSSGSEAPPAPPPWDQYNGNAQSSYPEPPAVPTEPSCFLSHSYSSPSSLQPVSSRLYSNSDQSSSSLQSLSSPCIQESATPTLFPKPIYSYSILIFMALKSSKTGSLPVSEIYSFMTEHFPYFKTAPDGWKNSVRHNLSLNKCFEKVENKTGNSSRKGCLWALNPAKVGKMQEELHKWRRKDPITVRRSMARPEDLDRLVGERPDKLRSLPPYTSSSLLAVASPFYNAASSPCSPARPRPPILHSQYAQMLPQQPSYLPPTTAHPTNSFALCSPCGRQPAAGLQPAPGGLRSPVAAKMPPVFNSPLQAEYSVGARTMQDLLLDGDVTYDTDTFNPALTDLQLHGNIWEELKETSLVSDRHITTAPSSDSPALHHPLIQTSCLQAVPPGRQTSEVVPCDEDVGDEETGRGQNVEQLSCLNGLQPVAYSSVENLAGYLTSCATSISLM